MISIADTLLMSPALYFQILSTINVCKPPIWYDKIDQRCYESEPNDWADRSEIKLKGKYRGEEFQGELKTRVSKPNELKL